MIGVGGITLHEGEFMKRPSCPFWIRTKISGFRGRCAAVTPMGKGMDGSAVFAEPPRRSEAGSRTRFSRDVKCRVSAPFRPSTDTLLHRIGRRA